MKDTEEKNIKNAAEEEISSMKINFLWKLLTAILTIIAIIALVMQLVSDKEQKEQPTKQEEIVLEEQVRLIISQDHCGYTEIEFK